MSVLINGMEMPTSCRMCPLLQHITADYDHEPFWYCALDNFKKSITPHPMTLQEIDNNRHRNCPLVPVPKHGDLIDRDPFIGFIKTHWDSYDQWFVDQLEARPTVIPADPAKGGE